MYLIRNGDTHKARLLWLLGGVLVVNLSCTMGC